MKLLLAGAGGQVGWEVARRAAPLGFLLDARPRGGLDITDPEAVRRAMEAARPDLVINAAAYTKVDQAESDREEAFRINRTGPGLLAAACAGAGIPMIHLSTDYVFNGRKKSPYRESDPICPLGVYGESKAEGETEVRRALPRHLIIRTAWVYGVHGANFVKTMLRLGPERGRLRVVADQFGCPTAAGDIADTLLCLARRIGEDGPVSWGTYHYCGRGITSWHGFAREIFRIAGRLGLSPLPEVEAIPTSEYPTSAARPAFSALDTTQIAEAFGVFPRPWEKSLGEVVGEMFKKEAMGEGR